MKDVIWNMRTKLRKVVTNRIAIGLNGMRLTDMQAVRREGGKTQLAGRLRQRDSKD